MSVNVSVSVSVKVKVNVSVSVSVSVKVNVSVSVNAPSAHHGHVLAPCEWLLRLRRTLQLALVEPFNAHLGKKFSTTWTNILVNMYI